MTRFLPETVRKTIEYCFSPDDADLHVAVNFNVDFYLPAGVMITSLFESNPDLVVDVHIFTDNAREEDLARLEATAKHYQRTIRLYLLDPEPFAGFHIHHHHYTRIAFARLYMPEVMVDYAPRYLYLDADTVVIGSLAECVDFDLGGKTIAAVLNSPDYNRMACEHHQLKHGRFINAGVMLVDARQWVEKGYTEKAFAQRGRPAKDFLGHDQDIVNITLDGDIALLPDKFNDFAGERFERGQDSVVIHYLGRIKPWKIALDMTPVLGEWRKYAKLSQWPLSTRTLPEKTAKNYYYYKHAARYYRQRGRWLEAARCYLVYLRLKRQMKAL